MSRKSALNDPYTKMLNEEALTLLDRILEHIQRGMAQEPVKTSVADYLRVLDTRLELLERLRADEPRTLEISYIPADWENEDLDEDHEDEPDSSTPLRPAA